MFEVEIYDVYSGIVLHTFSTNTFEVAVMAFLHIKAGGTLSGFPYFQTPETLAMRPIHTNVMDLEGSITNN